MRAIILLAGIAMAWSFTLTWVEPPFAGPHLSPLSALRDGHLIGEAGVTWQVGVFLGSFVVALLAAFFAISRHRRMGLSAAVAGAMAATLAVDLHFRTQDTKFNLDLPFTLDLSEPVEMLSALDDFVRVGFWAYATGALVLLVAGLVTLARRAG